MLGPHAIMARGMFLPSHCFAFVLLVPPSHFERGLLKHHPSTSVVSLTLNFSLLLTVPCRPLLLNWTAKTTLFTLVSSCPPHS
jgi:hypothetical protein